MQTTLRYFMLLAFLLALMSCEENHEETPSDVTNGYSLASGRGGESSAGGSEGNPTGADAPAPAPGQITAGEWSDLVHWDFWQTLKKNEDWQHSRDTWGFIPGQRYRLRVWDRFSRPVVDAVATLYDAQGTALWTTHTDAEGIAELWSQAVGVSTSANSIGVHYQGKTATLYDLMPYQQGEMTLQLEIAQSCPDQIDLVFTVDATGSMGDELEYLKSELNDVIARIEPTANVRLGTIFYRDEGDDYITRQFPFTTDISQMVEHIRAQSADGGGDFPEAVHTALTEAITQMEWSETATARLMFLLLDAPPHEDPAVKESLQEMVREASRKGIRIIPISASGIDKTTEFLLRSVAILTQGTYVFVTDHSGIGNDHLEPTVGEYKVELLNDLLVRLINQYGARCGVK